MLFKFLLFFSSILYSSEKEQKNYFPKSLEYIKNNFFNEHEVFNCHQRPGHGQVEGLYSLYGLQGEVYHSHGNMENLLSNKESQANFNDIKTGHFYYAISGILLHFLPTFYSVKVKLLYFDNMTEDDQAENNRVESRPIQEKELAPYNVPQYAIEKSRQEFDYPLVIKRYNTLVEEFFDEIGSYIQKEGQGELDSDIKKLHDNKDRIKEYHKKFEFLFDKDKRDKEKDKFEQEKVHGYIDGNNKNLIESLKKYTNENANGKEKLLSKEQFQEMTKILWEIFEKFPHQEIKLYEETKLKNSSQYKIKKIIEYCKKNYKREICVVLGLCVLGGLFWKRDTLFLKLQKYGFMTLSSEHNQKKR